VCFERLTKGTPSRIPPEMSNFCCLPAGGGGSPNGLAYESCCQLVSSRLSGHGHHKEPMRSSRLCRSVTRVDIAHGVDYSGTLAERIASSMAGYVKTHEVKSLAFIQRIDVGSFRAQTDGMAVDCGGRRIRCTSGRVGAVCRHLAARGRAGQIGIERRPSKT